MRESQTHSFTEKASLFDSALLHDWEGLRPICGHVG